MTFDPCPFTHFTDPIRAIMSVSLGKVLSHEIEGSIVCDCIWYHFPPICS